MKGYWIFFVASLLTALVFSGSGTGIFKEIFFSRFGVFENLTSLFYLIALTVTGHSLFVPIKTGASGKIPGSVFIVAGVSLLMLMEETFTNLFDVLEVILLHKPSSDAGLAIISFLVIVRLVAISSIIFFVSWLWKARRKCRAMLHSFRQSPSWPFWLLFGGLIILSALSAIGWLPLCLQRIEEWTEMNAALAWLIGSSIIVSGLAAQKNTAEKKTGEKEKPLLQGRFSRFFKFLKEED